MDKLSQERRSANMARIRSKDTSPELVLRKLIHGLGYRFRLLLEATDVVAIWMERVDSLGLFVLLPSFDPLPSRTWGRPVPLASLGL